MNAQSAIWFNENTGEVLCTDHSGRYLRASIDKAPRGGRKHVTPLGTWFRSRSAEDECERCLYGR